MPSFKRNRLGRNASVPAMLTLANEALRQGVAGLKQLEDLSDFLGGMLKAAAHIAAAQTGWIVLLDADAVTCRFAAVMNRDGELLSQSDGLFRPTSITPELTAWMTALSRGASAWPLSPNNSLHSPEMRTFHARQGNEALLNLPMRAAGRLIGWLGFGFPEVDASFGAAHLILEVLADQMTMAVELSRLAELKKHSAPARESEQAAESGAEELARANATIRSTLGHFIRSTEPDNFVRFALLEAAKQTRAVAAQVFRYSPTSNELRQVCAVREGQVFPSGHPDDPLEFQLGFHAGVTSAYQRFREDGGVIWLSNDPPDPGTWPFLASWNQKMNHHAYGGIALLTGDRPAGFLALEFSDPVSLTEIQSQLLIALGLQISLALELADLSHEGSHTVFAEDTQNADRERAAELAEAIDALKRSADRLASHPTTKAYLDAVLLEASAVVGARSAVIFEADPTGQWLSFAAGVIDSEVVDLALDPRIELLRTPVKTSPEDLALLLERRFRWFNLATEAHLTWQTVIPWHHQMGHKALAAFTLSIGTRLVGRLGLCFVTEQRPSVSKLELCSTLSQHAALAIELNRLSDEEKKAAVQAEQKKAARDRAAELSKASAAMQRSLERLSELNDLDEFIVEVLKTVEEVTGAVGSTVFLCDESNQTARAKAMVLEGRVRDCCNDPELLPFRNPVSLDGSELRKWERAFGSSGYHWSNVDDESDQPDTRAWHRARGHCTIVHFPLRRNTRRIGLLALSFREKFPPVPARLDLVGLLAQQLILAIETARLAEEGRQTAIVFERHKAAEERTVELAQANSSLRTTLDILGRKSDLSSFLQHVVEEAMKQLDARDGIIFVFNSENGTLSPAFSILDESLETGSLPYLNSSFGTPLSGVWTSLQRARKPLVFRMEQDDQLFESKLRSWHKARGTRTVVGVPMFLGGEVFGYVCLCLRRDSDGVSAFALEQVQALVQQATLALQLARLANAESKAEALREQEKAASERAAELGTANEVMQRIASRLLHASDPDAILPVIVSEACRVIGATECGLFEYRPEHQDLVLMFGIKNGELHSTVSNTVIGSPANPMPVGGSPAWEELLTRNHLIFEKAASTMVTRPFMPGLDVPGESIILQSVLAMDNQPVGFLSLALREDRQPSQIARETFNTLVQQATLALRMVSLSREAKFRASEAATLEERNRIAREIHDTLAQSFTGVLMQLHAIEHLEVKCEDNRIRLENATSIARNGLAEARRSVKALRPSELDSGSLLDALQLVAHLTEQQSGISVVVNCNAGVGFDPAHSGEILRIVQEAITNAVKHARATLITVSCRNEGDDPLVSVTDNGMGFKPERTTEGFGLIGMRERAAKIGGEIHITSGIGGTEICLIAASHKESYD